MSKRIDEIIAKFREENPMKVRRPRSRPKKTWKERFPEEYEASKKLWDNGYSLNQAAKFFNTSRETLKKHLKEDGLYMSLNEKTPKPPMGLVVDAGPSCPCGMGMQSICTVHKQTECLQAANLLEIPSSKSRMS